MAEHRVLSHTTAVEATGRVLQVDRRNRRDGVDVHDFVHVMEQLSEDECFVVEESLLLLSLTRKNEIQVLRTEPQARQALDDFARNLTKP